MRTFRIISVLLLAGATGAFAVKTERWEISSPPEFQRGKLHRLTVSSAGELGLGYGSTKLGEFAKEIWCSTVGRDGTIYFGTGSAADVYAVGKDGQATKIYETDAVAVTALATDSKGNIYAATLAEGKIYKIPADRKAGAEFCRLKAPYVWALVVDKEDRLYAGTGPDGRIYRIGTDGKAEEWYATEESNILSLALDADGILLAGGSDRGLLYGVSGKGKGVVLHEFGEDEVKALVISGRDLFIGVNRQKVRRPRGTGTRRPSASEFEDLSQRLTGQFGTKATIDAGRPQQTPAEARLGNLSAGTLYKRAANGRVDRWVTWENEAILAMAQDAEGGIILGLAGKGGVYRVPAADRWELLFDLDEQQALTLAVRDGRLAFLGAGNVGTAYLIDAQKATTGEYTSEVHDCKFLTTWGNVLWRGEGAVSVATRTGNTALPDATWSAWSEAAKTSPGKVSSPRGRFIQLQAQLARQSEPRLQSLTLYSQIQNQKPEVTAIDVGEKPKPTVEKPKSEGPGDQKPEDTSAIKPDDARPKPASTTKRITWRATDKDGDALVYRLFYQAQGDATWLPVFRDKPLKKTDFAWDTESIADGWYRLKVVVSDEESNPAGEALAEEKISDVFKVDNRRPDVGALAFDEATGTVTGTARDNLSLIRVLEYSLDGGEWKFFAPQDGVFDDLQEAFQIKPETLEKGPHTIAVRATDEEGNLGVEKLSFRAK